MGYITNNNPNKKIDLLTNVATMYYINGLTQREIAEQLGVGRTTIVRFLNEAKDLGIVTITERLHGRKRERPRHTGKHNPQIPQYHHSAERNYGYRRRNDN